MGAIVAKNNETLMKKFYFCPNCKRRIMTPKILLQPNLKIAGRIRITCDFCNKEDKGNPKGIIVIKVKTTL